VAPPFPPPRWLGGVAMGELCFAARHAVRRGALAANRAGIYPLTTTAAAWQSAKGADFAMCANLNNQGVSLIADKLCPRNLASSSSQREIRPATSFGLPASTPWTSGSKGAGIRPHASKLRK
jgi:hypothetical protein